MSDLDFLRNVTLLMEFEPSEHEAISKALKRTVHSEGEVILEEGSSNRALHIIRSGKVRISRRVDDRDVVLNDLIAGQTFGELSILEDGFATATVAAVTDCEILSLSVHDLAHFLGESPKAAAKFWRAIALDLRTRLVQTNDIVRTYFEVNRALVENPTFREAYAMCNR